MSDKQDNDFILFQFLAKAKISPEEAIQIKQYITNLIKETVKEVIITNIPKHECPIPKHFNGEVINLVNVMESIGDGNVNHGIERIRENHRFILKLKGTLGNIGKVITASLVVSLVGGLITAVIHFLKTGIK